MSGFVALIHFDGRPVDRDLLERLTDRVAYLGPDDRHIWSEGQIGFGHHLFRSTFACRNDQQPLVDKSGRVLVADGRIDDRVRLCEALRCAGQPVSVDAPASVLMMAAYHAWGSGAPEHLLGDFSFVLWDPEAGRVFAARDRFGLRSLYFAELPGGLILSNDVTPVLAHPSVSRDLDEIALADFLMFGKINALDKEQTPYRSVRQLGFGKSLIVEHGRITTRSFWSLPLQPPVLSYRSDHEYAEHFVSVLKEAVHDRVQGPSVVSLMSGGLDSPTATALAVELMRDGRGPESLVALTAVSGPEDPEGILAKEVARKLRIEHRTKQVPRGKPLENWVPTPFPDANFGSGHIDNARFAGTLGRLSLNAIGADYALCPEAFTIARQWRSAGPLLTLRALKVLRRGYHIRPRLGTGVWSKLVKRQRAGDRNKRPAARFPPWFVEAFRRRHDLDDRWHRFWTWQPEPPHRIRPTAHRMLLVNGNWTMRSPNWALNYTPPDAGDPFLDVRVLEFLFTVPPLPWFFDKHIIRYAMAGRLPGSVLNRPKTPAGRWGEELSRGEILDLTSPDARLSAMVDVRDIALFGDPRFIAEDVLPKFLDLWLKNRSVT